MSGRKCPSTNCWPTIVLSLATSARMTTIYRPYLSFVVAALLAVAFHYSYLLLSLPLSIRLASHACLVACLALLVLRRPVPQMAIGLGHYQLITISLVAVWGEILVGGYFGFEQTYTDWRKASLVALVILPFILAALRGSEQSATVRTFP